MIIIIHVHVCDIVLLNDVIKNIVISIICLLILLFTVLLCLFIIIFVYSSIVLCTKVANFLQVMDPTTLQGFY